MASEACARIAASYTAKAFGIKTGTLMREARKTFAPASFRCRPITASTRTITKHLERPSTPAYRSRRSR
jgi:nucleotidyltransferase/DNA polymerase involved in DNA repair